MRTFVGCPNYDFRGSPIPHSDAVIEGYVLGLRNLLRQKLDPNATNQFWQITDVARWFGTVDNEGYGFVVFHMDGDDISPSKTGPSWAFFIPGGYASGLVDVDDFLQANQIVNYARNSTNGSTTITTNGAPLFHYCETGGTTTPYGFGFNADGSLPGGDLSLPAIDPRVNLPGFMPGTTFLYGVIVQTLSDNVAGNSLAMVWDHDIACVVFYVTQQLLSSPNNVIAMGEIIEPFSTNDTRRSGVARWSVNLPTVGSDGPIAYQSCWAYNEAGTRTEYTITTHNKYVRQFVGDSVMNDFLLNGQWQWDPVLLTVASHFKGWFNTGVVRETIEAGANKVVGDFFKASATLMFMYDNVGYPREEE